MADISKSIERYIIDVIRVPRTDTSSAIKSREWLLGRVVGEIESRKNEPILYSEQPLILYGSYVKGTQVSAVDEFDIMLVIDSNAGVFSVGGQQVGDGLGSASPNHKYDNRFNKEDGSGISPAKILNWTKSVIAKAVEPFGGEAPDRDGQSVTAIIKSKDLKIDFVPGGIFQRRTDGKTFYDIPKGDRGNNWILTAPQEDIARLNDVATGKDNFRNVIRIAKRIKSTYNFLVSSFAIESAIVNYAQTSTWHDNLYYDTYLGLNYLASVFRNGNIPDSFEATTNLIAGVEQLTWYAERLDKINSGLRNCEQEHDQVRSDEKIRKLFENE